MNSMKIFAWILKLTVVFALPFQKKLQKRNAGTTSVGCMHMESLPGEYTFTSDGSGNVCGLYFISLPEQLIEIEFIEFNIDCEHGGLLAVVDGWELNKQFFPTPGDHHLSLQERYRQYCGVDRPRKTFVSSQNVALIQNRIPTSGQGFKVKVRFLENAQPCNAIAMFPQNVYTIKNFGEKRNCTLSIIFPERVRVVSVDVGVSAEKPQIEGDIGLTDMCFNHGGSDYVEIMGGEGFYMSPLNRRAVMCGMESAGENEDVVIPCSNTVIRMVSSGNYYNTFTFAYAPPSKEDLLLEILVNNGRWMKRQTLVEALYGGYDFSPRSTMAGHVYYRNLKIVKIPEKFRFEYYIYTGYEKKPKRSFK